MISEGFELGTFLKRLATNPIKVAIVLPPQDDTYGTDNKKPASATL
jgi:hypothetical protein